MSPDQKIEICKKARYYTRDCLLKVLKNILAKNLTPSETELRDMWLFELRKNTDFFEDGWYSPPPHGVSILIGTDKEVDQSRLNFRSLRPEKNWTRDDVYFNSKNGLVFAYASPIERNTGVIGDFAITLYFGKERTIIKHFMTSNQIIKKVFDFVELGKTFSEIAQYQKEIIREKGLCNEMECVTNPSSADDVGHSIPFIMENMTTQESKTLRSENSEEIKKMISEKRIFVRSLGEQAVQKGMAFTIEPRPQIIDNPKVPMTCFHSICVIYENGKKELITGFGKIFDIAGMKYM